MNPMILVNRSACKPLSHELWKEQVYQNKKEGKLMLHTWKEEKYLYKQILVRKHEGQKQPQKLMQRLGNNIKMNLNRS